MYTTITCRDNSIEACHGTYFLALLGRNSQQEDKLRDLYSGYVRDYNLYFRPK